AAGCRSSNGSLFFFSSRRRHTRFSRDWSSDVCSSDLTVRGKASANLKNARKNAPSVGPRLQNPLLKRLRSVGKGRKRLARPCERSEERRVGKECRSRGARAPRKRNRQARSGRGTCA